MKYDMPLVVILIVYLVFSLILDVTFCLSIEDQKQTISDLSDRLSYVEGSLRIYS